VAVVVTSVTAADVVVGPVGSGCAAERTGGSSSRSSGSQ